MRRVRVGTPPLFATARAVLCVLLVAVVFCGGGSPRSLRVSFYGRADEESGKTYFIGSKVPSLEQKLVMFAIALVLAILPPMHR